ncbi:transcriptional regulator NanR [Sodalis ligni]|uniref:transcriptional regulator NanR n=1 Tax=Sodalis ligni TaxID=2697027 RepID=UPI00193FAF5D|nr:transcriptional regulator NanR [Sodalis ligni]QWA11119.1 transcriptional regulator NanR [Sodalis ligni]
MTSLNKQSTADNRVPLMQSRPVKRKKLSDMVEEELEFMIRRGEFVEGDQLPSERELMDFFHVGRPSVREALAALKRKGLVQISNGERARVSRPSADTVISELSGMAKDFLTQPGGIKHFEQLRMFFESSLVRHAAVHATDAQISKLKQALEANSRALADNMLFVRTDVAFHRVLASIPGNPLFLTIHHALLDWLIAMRVGLTEPEEIIRHNSRSYEQHVTLYEAIRRHDADGAEKALQDHLSSVLAAYYART